MARLPSEHRPLSFHRLWSTGCLIISSNPPLSPTPNTGWPYSGLLQPRGHHSMAGQSGAWFFSPRGEEDSSTMASSAPYPSTTTQCAGEAQAAPRHLSPRAAIFFEGTKKPPFISAEKIMPCFQKGNGRDQLWPERLLEGMEKYKLLQPNCCSVLTTNYRTHEDKEHLLEYHASSHKVKLTTVHARARILHFCFFLTFLTSTTGK